MSGPCTSSIYAARSLRRSNFGSEASEAAAVRSAQLKKPSPAHQRPALGNTQHPERLPSIFYRGRYEDRPACSPGETEEHGKSCGGGCSAVLAERHAVKHRRIIFFTRANTQDFFTLEIRTSFAGGASLHLWVCLGTHVRLDLSAILCSTHHPMLWRGGRSLSVFLSLFLSFSNPHPFSRIFLFNRETERKQPHSHLLHQLLRWLLHGIAASPRQRFFRRVRHSPRTSWPLR